MICQEGFILADFWCEDATRQVRRKIFYELENIDAEYNEADIVAVKPLEGFPPTVDDIDQCLYWEILNRLEIKPRTITWVENDGK